MTSVAGSMVGKNAASPVHAAAQVWFARLMAPDCAAAERLQFQRWLAADPAHARAYEATERLWNRLDGMEEDDEIAAMAAEALEPEPAAIQRPRWFVPVALAASLLVAAVGGYVHWNRRSEQTTVGTGTYVTDRQSRQLMLEDGSVVKLDVATELKVTLAAQGRVLRLERGRAMFDVALDRKRPFTVHAGDGRVVALGTRFQVDRTGERIKVVLTDGAVTVTRASERITMTPGEELVFTTSGQTWVKRTIDPEPATSWVSGYHVFRATPLSEVVREINLYAERKIRLTGVTLANLPVSGSFKTGDSESIATALPSVLPVRVEQRATEIELIHR